jgi:hypothetical protein
MTYGWALLVVMVAGAALAYFGVYRSDSLMPERCLFTTGIYCKEHNIVDNGDNMTVQLSLVNKLGQSITLQYLNLTSSKNQQQSSRCTQSVTLKPDENALINCTLAVANPGNGKTLQLKAVLGYTFLEGTYNRVANGDITAIVQAK